MNSIFDRLLARSSQSIAYMTEEITHICRDMKQRGAGSAGEHEAADYMAEILREECGCDSVTREVFEVHPGSFWGYCFLTGLLGVLACAGFFLHPLVSLIIACLSFALFLFYFVLYKPVIDWMFPKKKSPNVTAVRHCTGEVKRRIFINGHVDAAWEFPLNYHFGGVVFETPNAMALAGVLFYIGLSVCALCNAGSWTHTVALFGLIFLPFFIAVAFTYNSRRVVDGANDNLTGCYMGISLLRQMQEMGITLEHTEIGVILTGSEEAGLRGAKAWVRKHTADYRDVPTYIFCFDTIHDPKFLMVNARDLNSTVKADPDMSDLFLQSCADLHIPCRKGRVPLFGGSTDSAAFTQGGFRSVAVTGLDHKLEDYYHTRRDTYDNLNAEGLTNCYKAIVRLVERIDQGALDHTC